MTTKHQFNRQKGDKIEWSQWTWNPIVGCKGPDEKGPCIYCYARDSYNYRMKDERYGGKPFTEPTFHVERLDAPKNTRLPPNPNDRHVFVCSMSDLFGASIPQDQIDYVLQAIWDSPEWTYILLTKNPKRLVGIDFPQNAWVGTTVDIQARVAPAQEAFKSVKATVRFLSCEPLQEVVTFSDLSMFNWMIIGGRSENSVLPAFKPPQPWIDGLVRDARSAGLKVYQKPNLGVDEATRLREYPAAKAYTTRDVFDFDSPRSP